MKRNQKLQERHEILLEEERRLWSTGLTRVGGVDEVGAGPLAGPVVAACVVLNQHSLEALLGVDDSKRLGSTQRTRLAEVIREHAVAWSVGEASVSEIDEINILQASLLAMRRSIAGILARGVDVEHLLIDARTLQDMEIPQTAILQGDAKSLSIAAASILAKVERDATMARLALEFPGYGLERNKGYGTAEHLGALKRLGAASIHRRSFSPVRDAADAR